MIPSKLFLTKRWRVKGIVLKVGGGMGGWGDDPVVFCGILDLAGRF